MALLSRPMAAAPFFVVVLLVLVAAERTMGRVVVEETLCLSQSHAFKGVCLSNTNCDNVCKTEKFTGGECKMDGVMRKCYCKKVC
ncbi:Defensin SD2 [Zea mays]|uniref:Defensin-like protein 6 n=2 Tax=Zea mays TaxID=4577 RepID=A0A1D6H4M3_MAIZE|nr:Defensin-like protein CAL1 precursor [Zea mays]AQK69772.1 Defensin-like protein 6 [Zea mays]PWZ23786.1 Defensin SD2 [Zea mays]|eukprot:NP_001152951.2 uncharacterized protein LOC100285747 precursor [Zea mays]